MGKGKIWFNRGCTLISAKEPSINNPKIRF